MTTCPRARINPSLWSAAALVMGAVAAPIALAWFLRASDRRREPKRIVAVTFLLGMLAPLPVVWLTPNALRWFPSVNPFQAALLTAFGMAAIPEELVKFAVLNCYSARRRAFDEPFDGLVYGVVAALGFAASENIAYALVQGWHATIFRSFTAIPLHAAAGAIMGFYVARARFEPGERYRALAKALAVPIVVHGCYDFPLFVRRFMPEGEDIGIRDVWLDAALGLVSIAVLASAMHEARRLWREGAENSPSRESESPQSFDAARQDSPPLQP